MTKLTKMKIAAGLAALGLTPAMYLAGPRLQKVPPAEVQAPSVEEKPVSVEKKPVTVEVAAPAPATEGLDGYLWLIAAAHFDGMKNLSSAGVPSWKAEATAHAASMSNRGIKPSWELTADEVKKIGDKSWFTSIASTGVVFAGREAHGLKGSGGDPATSAASEVALSGMGIVPPSYLGSTLDPSVYAGARWAILTGIGSLGHTADADWSGFRSAGFKNSAGQDVTIVGSGTANSVAIKRGIARDVCHKNLPWAVEIIRYNAVSLDGKGTNFVSPERHGTQAPVPITEDIDRVLGDIAADGNLSCVKWTTYEDAVARAKVSGLSSYTIEKTAK